MINIQQIVDNWRNGWSECDFEEKMNIFIVSEDELDIMLNNNVNKFNEEIGEINLEETPWFKELDNQLDFIDFLIHIGELEPNGVLIDDEYYYEKLY